MDGPVCRVCHGESEPGRELFFPCKCDGSIKYVHQDCLQEWLKHARNKMRCELCGEEFKFKKIYKEGITWHLSLLEIAMELFPRLARIVTSSCHLLLSLFCWLIVLPMFAYYWIRISWCLVSDVDREHCFSLSHTLYFKFSFPFMLHAWYGGFVNICIIAILTFFSVEIYRFYYKKISDGRKAFKLMELEIELKNRRKLIRDVEKCNKDLILDIVRLIQKLIDVERASVTDIYSTSWEMTAEEFESRHVLWLKMRQDIQKQGRPQLKVDRRLSMITGEATVSQVLKLDQHFVDSLLLLLDAARKSSASQSRIRLIATHVSTHKLFLMLQIASILQANVNASSYVETLQQLVNDCQMQHAKSALISTWEGLSSFETSLSSLDKNSQDSVSNEIGDNDTNLILNDEPPAANRQVMMLFGNIDSDTDDDSCNNDEGFEVGQLSLTESPTNHPIIENENQSDNDKNVNGGNDIFFEETVSASEVTQHEDPPFESFVTNDEEMLLMAARDSKLSHEQVDDDINPTTLKDSNTENGYDEKNTSTSPLLNETDVDMIGNLCDEIVTGIIDRVPAHADDPFVFGESEMNDSFKYLLDREDDECLDDEFEHHGMDNSDLLQASRGLPIFQDMFPDEQGVSDEEDYYYSDEEDLIDSNHPRNDNNNTDNQQPVRNMLIGPQVIEIEPGINVHILQNGNDVVENNGNVQVVDDIQPLVNEILPQPDIANNNGQNINNRNNNGNNEVELAIEFGNPNDVLAVIYLDVHHCIVFIFYIVLFTVVFGLIPISMGRLLRYSFTSSHNVQSFQTIVFREIREILLKDDSIVASSAAVLNFFDVRDEFASLDFASLSEVELTFVIEAIAHKILVASEFVAGCVVCLTLVISLCETYILFCFVSPLYHRFIGGVEDIPEDMEGEVVLQGGGVNATGGFRTRMQRIVQEVAVVLDRVTHTAVKLFVLIVCYLMVLPVIFAGVMGLALRRPFANYIDYSDKQSAVLLLVIFAMCYFLSFPVMMHIGFIVNELRVLIVPLQTWILPPQVRLPILEIARSPILDHLQRVQPMLLNRSISEILTGFLFECLFLLPGLLFSVVLPLRLGHWTLLQAEPLRLQLNSFMSDLQVPGELLLSHILLPMLIDKLQYNKSINTWMKWQTEYAARLAGCNDWLNPVYFPHLFETDKNADTNNNNVNIVDHHIPVANVNHHEVIQQPVLPPVEDDGNVVALPVEETALLGTDVSTAENESTAVSGEEGNVDYDVSDIVNELVSKVEDLVDMALEDSAEAMVIPFASDDAQSGGDSDHYNNDRNDDGDDDDDEQQIIDCTHNDSNEVAGAVQENEEEKEPELFAAEDSAVVPEIGNEDPEPAVIPTDIPATPPPLPPQTPTTPLAKPPITPAQTLSFVLIQCVGFALVSCWFLHWPLYTGRYVVQLLTKLLMLQVQINNDLIHFPIGVLVCGMVLQVLQYIWKDIVQSPGAGQLWSITWKWTKRLAAVFVGGLLWMIVLPLLIGYLLVACCVFPFRTDFTMTPFFPVLQAWALGVVLLKLFAKGVLIGVFGEIPLRLELEMLLIRGFAHFDLSLFWHKIFVPMAVPLCDLVMIPLCLGRVAGMFTPHQWLTDRYLAATVSPVSSMWTVLIPRWMVVRNLQEQRHAVYLWRVVTTRFSFHVYVLLKALLYTLKNSVSYAVRVYNEIRDKRYLIGTELTNRTGRA